MAGEQQAGQDTPANDDDKDHDFMGGYEEASGTKERTAGKPAARASAEPTEEVEELDDDTTNAPAPSPAPAATPAAAAEKKDDTTTAPAVAAPAATPAPPAPKPKHVKVTQEQWDQVSAAARLVPQLQQKLDRDVYGRLGGLQESIARLTQGGRVEITDDDFKDLQAEFPDAAPHIRKLMENLLNKTRVLPAMAPAPQPQQQGQQRELTHDEEVRVAEDRLEQMKYVTSIHPDWEQIKVSDAFKGWVAGLDDAHRNRLMNAWDGDYIERQITRFKRAQARAAAPSPSPAPANPQADLRRQRMAGAINPRGDGGGMTISRDQAEDEFASGYKAESDKIS